ncbi:MAG: DMT family transporter [Myxococcaceae bacterium]
MNVNSRAGLVLALSSAALFGVAAPLSKRLLAETPPVLLAALLYLGAGLGVTLYRLLARRTAEAPLRREDAPLLAGIILCGGVAGPVLMLFGLTRVSGLVGSLLLNLEAPFTIGLAVLLLREHLGRREVGSVAAMLGGAALLGFRPGELRADALGVLCIALACLAWAVDNTLTARLALKDPVALTRLKTLGAGAANLVIALAMGAGLPPLPALGQALTLGALAYGLSIVLAVHAVRRIGAARQAALFAFAPFAGAALAVALLGDRPGGPDLAAAVLLGAGALGLAGARHSHPHRHEGTRHEHLHVHDEHHQHPHPPGVPPAEPHSHAHQHAPLAHDHPHLPDAHHRHTHGDEG